MPIASILLEVESKCDHWTTDKSNICSLAECFATKAEFSIVGLMKPSNDESCEVFDKGRFKSKKLGVRCLKSLSIIRKISNKNRKPKAPPIGKYLALFSLISANEIESIITTNKKSTAIAPTYTTKKIRAKKSNPKRSKSPALLKKTNIRNKTEYTGFLACITITAETKAKLEKM